MAITPDTKDWTWVLEKPCAECGFEAAAVRPEDIAPAVRDNAAAWPAILQRPDVAQRPNPRTWSPLEYACHVRDVLDLYDQRLALMLAQDNPLYPNWDQDESAEQERYGEQEPQQVASELQAAGERVARSFEVLDAQQWQRPGRRSDGAAFTVESFARYFLHDVVHHRWDVAGSVPV